MENNIDYDVRTVIKDRLISLRIESEKTQTDFGKIFDKSKTTVASWEQGLSLPDVATLYRIALYFNKSISYMYGEEPKEGD